MITGTLHPGFIFSIAFQPLPIAIPSASVAAGGNAHGLSSEIGDRMWMEYDISRLTALGDKDTNSMVMNITATIDQYAKETYPGVKNSHYKSGDLQRGISRSS
jgi:hypothetical protein